jgi:hypothetical protein
VYRIIGTDEKEYGPVPTEQVRQWSREGRLNRTSRVKPEGAVEWQTLGVLAEFADLFPPPISPVLPPVSGGDGVNVIIPYKNVRALVAYYLAVFSLIPFLGMPLGLVAFVLGILGLRYRRANPAAGGVVHAWIGIVLGGLCGFGYLALIVVVVITAMAKHH